MRAFLLILALAMPARAFAGGLDQRLEGAGWALFTMPGERSAHFSLTDEGAVRIEASDAVGFLYRAVSSEEITTSLAWEWRVEQASPATDLAAKGGDDRSLAVHLWFAPERPGIWGALKRAAGLPLVGEMLTYVHGGTAPPGTIALNPYYERGRIITLRTGDGDGWQRERIDFASDYERAFGGPPPPLSYVALSSDTDATGATAIGSVRALTFSVP